MCVVRQLSLLKSNENNKEITIKICYKSFLKEMLRTRSSPIMTPTLALLILKNAIANANRLS